MDEPDHGPYRAIAQPWFQPSTLASLEPWLRTWAKQCVDTITALNGTCDFAAQIAVPYTFRIITRIMGIREASEPQLDRLLRGLVGAEDPLRRLVDPPANPVHAALRGCRDYFEALATERRTCPRDDLASALANAKVNGDNLPSFESVSYYVLLAIAGYDTTAFALSGGLHALIQHPAQLARLRQDPSLLEAAVEEILRWTSPSRHFMRTATRDTELSGHTIRSANRDESLFKDPDSFQIDRTPNPHITFGWGPHYCLGQALARLELCALFAELLPRLHAAELAGPTRRAHSVFLTGFTSLPVALDVA
jgi:cytochrome P450